MILSNDPETLHEKDLGILQYVTHVVTTLRESLVLLDGGIRAIQIRSGIISDNHWILLFKCDSIKTIIMLFPLVSFCFAVGINLLI